MLNISNPANLQEQSCYENGFGIFAKSLGMQGIETDTALIKDLLAWANLTPAGAAKKAGVAASTINRPYRGTALTRISAPTLDKLRRAFPSFPGWVNPEADLPEVDAARAYVAVDILPTFAGAGGGGTGDGDRETALVPRALIVDILRGKPSDFLLVDIRGDSMEPDFRHGDQLLIDCRDTSPSQPGPFALWDGEWGEYVVKNVERSQSGEVRIFSSNEKYTSSIVASDSTKIIGRPVWYGRRL